MRIPDYPTIDDLRAIGNGNESYDEDKNGLLVLDECGSWFNSRSWQDKSRSSLNDWFRHSRKLGWDVMILVQDVTLLDSQARDALGEMTAFCKRLDRVAVPVIGTAFKALTGSKLKPPKVHMARVVYGIREQDLLSDRWVYRGTSFYSMYETKQIFTPEYPHGTFSYLPPWHTTGRFRCNRDWEFFMRMTRIAWKRFKSPVALAAGVLVGVAMAAAVAFGSLYADLKSQQSELQRQTLQVMDRPSQPAPKETETKPDPIDERLADLRIVGSANLDGEHYYDFQLRSDPETVLSSRDLADMGVKVDRFGHCYAILRRQRSYYPTYCSF